MCKIKLSRMYLRLFAIMKTYETLFTGNSEKDFFDEAITMTVIDCLQAITILNLFYTHASIQRYKAENDSYIVDNVFLKDIFDNDILKKCLEKFDIKLQDNSNVTELYKSFTNNIDPQKIKKMDHEKIVGYFIDIISSDEELLKTLSIEKSLFVFNKKILLQIIVNTKKDIFQRLIDWDFYEEKDKIFFNTLIKGAIETKGEVDNLIAKYSINWAVDRFFLIDKVIISLAYSDVKYMGTPRIVVINEYLNLTKLFNGDKSSRFLNAILDKIL